jgi:indolepyruvate ferredoxin oxidoreductase beta subunit
MKEIAEMIHRFARRLIIIETRKLAEEAGSSLTQNTVLIGVSAASGRLPIRKESIIEALRELVPATHVDMNVKAFELGYKSAKKDKN